MSRQFLNLVAIIRRSAGEYLEPGLIQHNPDIADGQKALEAYYKTAEVIKMHKVIGEGDFVLTQSSGKFGTLPHVVYDIYRLANGRIVEHWSVKQEIPTEMAHSNGMVGWAKSALAGSLRAKT